MNEEGLGRLNGHLQLVLLLGWSFGCVVGVVAVWLVVLMVQCIVSGRCDETVDYMEFLSVYLLFRHEAHASVARSHSRLGQWYVFSTKTTMKCGNVLCYNLTLTNGMFLHKNTSRVPMSLL